MNSSGLGMVYPRQNGQTMAASGPSPRRKTIVFAYLLARKVCTRRVQAPLVVFAQSHAVVKAGNLVAVAVEHQRLVRFEEFREAPLASLAPAWVIHVRIHVGVEAIFPGRVKVPGGWRLVLLKFNFYYRLDALEPIFPRYDQAHWSAILIGQCFAIHADAQKGQRVHGFIQAQSLDVGKLDSGFSAERHLRRIVIAFEGDETRFWRGLHQFGEHSERKTHPRHYD